MSNELVSQKTFCILCICDPHVKGFDGFSYNLVQITLLLQSIKQVPWSKDFNNSSSEVDWGGVSPKLWGVFFNQNQDGRASSYKNFKPIMCDILAHLVLCA